MSLGCQIVCSGQRVKIFVRRGVLGSNTVQGIFEAGHLDDFLVRARGVDLTDIIRDVLS